MSNRVACLAQIESDRWTRKIVISASLFIELGAITFDPRLKSLAYFSSRYTVRWNVNGTFWFRKNLIARRSLHATPSCGNLLVTFQLKIGSEPRLLSTYHGNYNITQRSAVAFFSCSFFLLLLFAVSFLFFSCMYIFFPCNYACTLHAFLVFMHFNDSWQHVISIVLKIDAV